MKPRSAIVGSYAVIYPHSYLQNTIFVITHETSVYYICKSYPARGKAFSVRKNNIFIDADLNRVSAVYALFKLEADKQNTIVEAEKRVYSESKLKYEKAMEDRQKALVYLLNTARRFVL